jgi:hypothetical protein
VPQTPTTQTCAKAKAEAEANANANANTNTGNDIFVCHDKLLSACVGTQKREKTRETK